MNRAIYLTTHSWRFSALVLIIVPYLVSLPGRAQLQGGHKYYLDCSGHKNGTGNIESPWNTLRAVNRRELFGPGDSILLKRGTTCLGGLTPKGSGAPGAPITIDAYGVGPRPIISAGSRSEALKLYNQQYWNINNLETSGGAKFSVDVDGDESINPLHHIYFTNCAFHDSRASAGAALSISQKGHDSTDNAFDDILVDGVTIFNSGRDGVLISASNAIFRNSTVYNVKGSGMIFAGATNVLADANVIHDIGRSSFGGNGLWEWLCTNCTIQNNEVYNTTDLSHNADGGAFDIDYNNVNNTLQYNYGHDADGYCISIFGSTDKGIARIVTTNSIVRYNICSNTGQGPAHYSRFPQKADILIKTWINSGDQPGSLNGVQILNNTIYHNPATPVAAIQEDREANFTGSLPSFVKNNVIYSSTTQLISTLEKSPLVFDNNLYWYTGDRGQEVFTFRGRTFRGFGDFQKMSAQESHGVFRDPLLADPGYHGIGRPVNEFVPSLGSPVLGRGTDICAGVSRCSNGGRDFLGNRVMPDRPVDIGAIQIAP